MKLTQEATVHGIDVAFIFTTVLIIVGFILALFIKEEKSLIIQNCIRETELWDEPGTQIDVLGFIM